MRHTNVSKPQKRDITGKFLKMEYKNGLTRQIDTKHKQQLKQRHSIELRVLSVTETCSTCN